MPIVYSMPMPTPHYYTSAPYCSTSPCFTPSLRDTCWIFLAIWLAPTILGVAFSLLAMMVRIGFIMMCIHTLTSFFCPFPSACFPSARSQARACPSTNANTSGRTVREELNKTSVGGNESAPEHETVPRRHDLSSMRVEKGKAEVTLIVSAPGVATEDLEVLTLSNTIHVKGSSTANGEVWSVNQQISVAAHSDIDIESACATHANGVVTIRMKRKAGKNIPILKLQPDRVNLHEAHGQHTESIEKDTENAQADTDESLETKPISATASTSAQDDWESLPNAAME